MHIGCHLSVAKGFGNMGRTALEIGADTFQFFTRNPRGGKAAQIDEADADILKVLAKANDFGEIVAHGPYTLNMASHNPQNWEFAQKTLREDLLRLEKLPCRFYNFHPGNHLGKGIDYGIGRIADGLNEVLTGKESSLVLLETMAGKGTEVGRTFEELKGIMDRVKFSENMGVCMDSCHMFDSGYDIKERLEEVLTRFDEIIGMDKLYAVHLNDSKNQLGSGKDRHACLGKGEIGLEALVAFAGHPEIRRRPLILETPNDLEGYREEIGLLRRELI